MFINAVSVWLSRRTFWKLCLAVELLVLLWAGFKSEPFPQYIPDMDKWLHGLAFAVATLTGLFAVTHRWQWWAVVVVMILLGLGIEIGQDLFLPGRTFDWGDLFVDIMGVALAMASWWLLNTLVVRRQLVT